MHYPLRLQQMPFVMSDYGTKGVAQAEMDEWNKVKRNPDAAKVFGGRMTKNIIQCVAFSLETINYFFPVRLYSGGCNGFYRFHFQDAAVGPGDNFIVAPVAQPTTVELIGSCIRRQGYAGEDMPDIDVIGEIEVPEYFEDAPLPRSGCKVELIVCQTEKGLCAGFDQFGPVQ